MVSPLSVNQDEFSEHSELLDGEVRRHDSLSSLSSRDADANVGLS